MFSRLNTKRIVGRLSTPDDEQLIVTVLDLEKRAFRNRINEIRIGVGLKNGGALIFWTKFGYDMITKITGDTEFGSDKFAVIELKK